MSAVVACSARVAAHPQHKRKERIKLLERKGFVKIAVETGLDGGIIPVYHFGNTQVGPWGHECATFHSNCSSSSSSISSRQERNWAGCRVQ
jgi:hypothetical protein